ncbi:MAG: LysR family transcriptional regulator [Gammaproteobacteria bacterium]|nr:LysR family transcriptional regulator [Gammaproteobacteria bacterium]
MNTPEWGLIRAFLAVAREGSLSAAARVLGDSQPTLTRAIQALEATTKLNLFKRTTQGLQLTDQGQALMDAALRMEEGALSFARQAGGLAVEIAGEVRLSVNEILGFFVLPPAIAALRAKYPGVQVEIVITNDASSLSKREADVALRMFQPTQPDLVARRLPDMAMGFFAHKEYLRLRGHPQTFEELLKMDVIGMDLGRDFIDGAAHFGIQLTREDFPIRTDHLLSQINLIRAGAGITATHIGLARHWPQLVQILPEIPLPPMQFWLVCHRDVQYNTRIRAVMQFFGEWFADDPYRGVMV